MIIINTIVRLNGVPRNGAEVVFRAPASASAITGLKIIYEDDDIDKHMEFAFADAHGNDIGNVNRIFDANAVVKVILDVTTGRAFIQNADTNTYLEDRFANLESLIGTGGGGGGSNIEIITWEDDD